MTFIGITRRMYLAKKNAFSVVLYDIYVFVTRVVSGQSGPNKRFFKRMGIHF